MKQEGCDESSAKIKYGLNRIFIPQTITRHSYER